MRNTIVSLENKINIDQYSKIIYLPGLNGIRAIAAIAVVISHITLGLGEFGLNNKIFGTDMQGNAKGLALAGNGVTIFFTLSGFLITFLLLKEKETSPLKIKNFYVRRVLRIWPLYYLYFLATIITAFIYGITYEKSSVPFYIFLAANIPLILRAPLPHLAHYWSLGVEEQFYLFFPQIGRLSNRSLLRIVYLLILIFLFFKFVFWILSRRYGIELPFVIITVTRFHVMLIGVVGAILYYYKNQRFLLLATHQVTQVLVWTCLFLITINKFHLASVIDGELISILSVFLIIGQITKKNHLINLENRIFDFIGKISYGIYVIHPLIIFYSAKVIGHFENSSFLKYLLVYSLVTSTTILIAYLSYELYEKRFLQLKAKFTTVHSSASIR